MLAIVSMSIEMSTKKYKIIAVYVQSTLALCKSEDKQR